MKKLTYVQQSVKNNRLIRWPDSAMPLLFYIAPFRWYRAKEEEYKYRQIVINALNVWTQASNGKISFQVVNTLNESQINLDWKRVDRKALGHCYFHYDSSARLYSAEVHIGLSDGILHARYMDEAEVFHTILHEIGHAIGLNHSDTKNDIMYVPHQYGVTALSQRDKDTLKWLYAMPIGASVSEIASKYRLTGLTDLDDIISKIASKKHSSQFEEVKNSLITDDSRDLNDERELLANINLFNLAIQDIKLPPKIKKYVKKPEVKE